MRYRRIGTGLCVGLLAAVLFRAAATSGMAPPSQPEEGPGGKQHSHTAVTKHRYGAGGTEYWLYEPNAPKPTSAPLIIFLHGWGGTNPATYGAWLDHLVKRGNIVVYPRYQTDLHTLPAAFNPNAMTAIQDAIRRLQNEQGHVRPDLSKFAVVGHSAGGLVAASVAALASASGLPPVRALMCVEPGRTTKPAAFGVPLANPARIPAQTLLLAVAGDQDTIVGDGDAKRIVTESAQVPAANKDFILVVSDSHGRPALKASHFAPCALDASYSNGETWGGNSMQTASEPTERSGAMRERLRQRFSERRQQGGGSEDARVGSRLTASLSGTDALDYYGYWKLFDGLCDAAFTGRNREYALGNTPQQRFMGRWSDGVPVKELFVTDRP